MKSQFLIDIKNADARSLPGSYNLNTYRKRDLSRSLLNIKGITEDIFPTVTII